jgi:hypothetical protein
MEERYPVLRGNSNAAVLWKRWALVWALAGALSGVARASTINDPQMGMEPEGDSNPFQQNSTVTPDGNGGGFTDFFNNTGSTILSVTFSAMIGAGLTGDELPPFSCNEATDPTVPNPFFLFCSVNYFQNNGTLEFVFFGTEPGSGGPDEGIAPLENFAISFNNNYSLTVDQGGWNVLNDPTFTATSVQTDPSPEPASAWLAGLALTAGLCWSLVRRRRTAALRTAPQG